MLHKLWLAERLDRDSGKRRRDRRQAEAVHLLLVRHLPQYPLDDAFSAGLPGGLARDARPAPTGPRGRAAVTGSRLVTGPAVWGPRLPGLAGTGT